MIESKVLETKYVTPKVIELKLSRPDDFRFEAGQFISMIKDDVRTSYSIASTPKEKYIRLCIKLNEGSVRSEFIKNLKKGDKVNLIGPMGNFTIKNRNKDIVFVATGVGIAPFMSMIGDLLDSNKNKIILLIGVRFEEDVLYKEEIDEFKKNDNFEHYSIISRPEAGEKGRVQILIEKHVPKDFTGDFYLCGFKPMVMDVLEMLKNKGIAKERVHFERFS